MARRRCQRKIDRNIPGRLPNLKHNHGIFAGANSNANPRAKSHDEVDNV